MFSTDDGIVYTNIPKLFEKRNISEIRDCIIRFIRGVLSHLRYFFFFSDFLKVSVDYSTNNW